MTTFILHGGALSRDNPHHSSFFKEFTKDLKDGDKVLFVGFARREREERLKIYERDRSYILASTDKELVVENAELDKLIDQTRSAQAIFVTGGDALALQADIASKPGFFEAMEGKIYAGSSAGAMITSRYMYACSDKVVREGLGWLPIRLMVHYGNPAYHSTEESKPELEAVAPELELVLLPECEWRVFQA